MRFGSSQVHADIAKMTLKTTHARPHSISSIYLCFNSPAILFGISLLTEERKQKMMMMMTEVTDQKRRSHDSFLLGNIAGAGRGHSHGSGIATTTTTCSGLTAKRLKTSGGAGGGGVIFTKVSLPPYLFHLFLM